MGEINIDATTLKQLNDLAKKLAKKDVPSEFLEKMMRKCLDITKYQNFSPNASVKTLKKWEVISIVLDFYKSIDDELYKKVFDVVMNIDSKKKFNIYDIETALGGFNQRDFEYKNFRKYELSPFNISHENKDIVYIPLKSNSLSGPIKLEKDTATLTDAYIMTHELAHTFDIYLDNILDSKGENIKDVAERNILTESTAIAFEELFTKYLFQKNIINDSKYIENIIINRNNNDCTQTEKSYGRLVMVNKIKRNGEITKNDVLEILNKLDLTPEQKNRYIKLLIKEGPRWLEISIGYAISGMISPTIEKNIEDGNIESVKEYLKYSQITDFEKALNALGISMDEEGLNKLQNNAQKALNNQEPEEKGER